MTAQDTVSRRSILRNGALASGAIVSGGATVVGRSIAQETQTDLVSQIEAHGHYQWFPFGPESWGQSSTPFDMQEGESRWLVQPEADGGVRCLGQNFGTDPPNRNVGFDIHLGRLGEIETVTVTSRTLRTPHTSGPAVLFIGLYLDTDANGEFFEWETSDGIERFVDIGGDEGGMTTFGASGELTIDGDTQFDLIVAGTEVSLDELKEGRVEGVTEETAVALFAGVMNDGEGTDEIVIEDVTVQRS